MRETLIYLSHLDHDDTEKQVCELESTASILLRKTIVSFCGFFLNHLNCYCSIVYAVSNMSGLFILLNHDTRISTYVRYLKYKINKLNSNRTMCYSDMNMLFWFKVI